MNEKELIKENEQLKEQLKIAKKKELERENKGVDTMKINVLSENRYRYEDGEDSFDFEIGDLMCFYSRSSVPNVVVGKVEKFLEVSKKIKVVNLISTKSHFVAIDACDWCDVVAVKEMFVSEKIANKKEKESEIKILKGIIDKNDFYHKQLRLEAIAYFIWQTVFIWTFLKITPNLNFPSRASM